jgi:hypothetical protein
MEQFITWYCSEPRLALNRTVVLRFRLYLESLGLAAGTINQRLAAVRRLAYEAADSGLLSPELAAGIRRVISVASTFWRPPQSLADLNGRLRPAIWHSLPLTIECLPLFRIGRSISIAALTSFP